MDGQQNHFALEYPCHFKTERRWFVMRAAPVGEGALQAVILQLDITECIPAEEAPQEAHDKLEQRVTERTAELGATNEQFRVEVGERKRAKEKLQQAFAGIERCKSRLGGCPRMAVSGGDKPRPYKAIS